MTKFAFIFPGQGSQSIGMGKALADAFPSAKAVFDEVDEALSEKLSALIFEGDQETLTLTTNAQPALMATSLAVMKALETEFDIHCSQAGYVAGHSLGEYSALAAAGALQISDTARLLRLRGQAMQNAVAVGVGAMAALLGADPDQAEAACAAGRMAGVCEIANDNAPGQIVISGEKGAIDLAIASASELGIKKAMPLAVSAPFHCSLMSPAAEAMREALAQTKINTPNAELVANVTANASSQPDAIRQQLTDQVTGRVRWRESVIWMHAQGVNVMVEAGAGKVLTVMNRRTVKEIEGITLNLPEQLEEFARKLQG